MKKIFTVLCCSLSTLAVCQNIEGEVHYEETIKMEIKFDDSEHMEAVKSMLPKSRTQKKQLLFNPESSIYRNLENEEDHEPMEFTSSDGGMVKIMMKQSDEQTFQNLKTSEIIEKREFMGKDFLIRDEQKTIPWKLTGEQKEILAYACQKAIWKDSSRVVEAWFTPQIPVSTGPSNYAKLPGLILEINVDNGKQIIIATDVELKDIDKDLLKAPKKGKSVDREAFKEIVKEKTRELQESMGGKGATFRIIEKH
ncbi:GLPGLI family protein [Fulvivirgaceae bacterium BMA10]|uniref:GLPGLI family protein n=1 Tax=Splendidivirga corallicola TaxID=3051826 RepID=A0ABT8KSI0_9BACT|nr:GLPGLI family protein [Fulvivirgaceae bacterium BMA10]